MKFNCIQIELTNNCNYRCPKCPRHGNDMKRKRGYADTERVKRLLDESFRIAKYVNFSFFGEPLLHPDFNDILEHTKNKPAGFKVVINTNLSLLTKDIMKKFIECRLNQLRISVDAATNEVYDLVRPSASCKNLDGVIMASKNRLHYIDEKLKFWFGLKNHTPTRHVMPVSSINKNEIKQYILKWHPLLSPRDSILLKSILTYGGKIKDSEITKNSCNVWSSKFLTIDWEGNVSPCNLDTDMNLIIGNVKDKSIMQMWKTSNYNTIKQKSIQQKIYPCKTCIDANNYTKNITITKNTKLNDQLFRRISNTYGLV